jgi:hypothetical protein
MPCSSQVVEAVVNHNPAHPTNKFALLIVRLQLIKDLYKTILQHIMRLILIRCIPHTNPHHTAFVFFEKRLLAMGLICNAALNELLICHML